MTTSHDEGADRRETGRSAWIVGADGFGTQMWSGEPVEMPTGRLHAVDGAGFLLGRAVCLVPVVLLDPADWRWPDDAGDEWPLCWICCALTR
ncbi:hypothetical protein SAMN05660748_0717 [Blastococcus aggregatus]|uniref:Uncharacterized protein n=1 Tax=Blastococcus aggregatus TaxID=38502 RepID=A0A285V0W8_9ACTN|nr:hypothetical protein [Blastococcus aggregatus]SOC47258.1 hypothetical protein SAMN05660748_0717 [Blastococcus aggregatus]